MDCPTATEISRPLKECAANDRLRDFFFPDLSVFSSSDWGLLCLGVFGPTILLYLIYRWFLVCGIESPHIFTETHFRIWMGLRILFSMVLSLIYFEIFIYLMMIALMHSFLLDIRWFGKLARAICWESALKQMGEWR
ncbi:MAG: hypothetical protein AAFR84_15290 [Pseudomonadota bacterium]